MNIETKYATIDRDELKRLQADSEELANLLAAQQQAEPVMQVSPEVSKQISKRGRDAIMAAERLVTLDESKTVSLEDMESRFGVEPATHPEDGGEAFAFHMGDASRLFDLIATDQISRCVDCEQFGAMGATEVTYWNTKVGLILERRNSMGGMSVYLHSAQSGRQVGEPRLISYAEDMSTCTLTLGDGVGYFYNRVTDAELDAEDARQQSEDGREVPEIVGKFCWMDEDMGDGYYVQCVHDLPEHIIDNERELMTVAQHERIVAAKDWEISTITAWWRAANVRALEAEEKVSKMEDCAQPARQVGDVQLTGEYHADVNMLLERIPRQVGDEQIKNDSDALVIISRGVLAAAIYAIREKKDAPVIIEKLRKASIGDEVHYAALAPAAAAVVLPERMVITRYSSDEYAMCAKHWNEALDSVGRLNRRAIPAGLLERIAKIPLGSQGLLDHASAMDELRALLGKS